MISCSFPTLVIIPTIICCFRCCFIFDFSNLRSYILYSKGGISFSACTPFDYKLAELFSLIVHPLVCIRFQLRLSEIYQLFFHSPASVHSSRWPFLKGVHSNGCVWSCIWPFILLFLLAFNCVEHQLLRKLRRVSHNFKGCLIYETSQPQKPKWFTSSMGEMFHRSNWLLMWSYHILTGNGKQERVSRDFSVPTVAHVGGFGCFEFASVWVFYEYSHENHDRFLWKYLPPTNVYGVHIRIHEFAGMGHFVM